MTPTWAYRDFDKFIILLLLLGQRPFFTENLISVTSDIRERGAEVEGGGRKAEKGERKRGEKGEYG